MLKEEFEKLAGGQVSAADYRTIEYVYTWHPSISETDGKTQIADIYRNYGMCVISGMVEAAQYVEDIHNKKEKYIRKLKKLDERLLKVKKGDFIIERIIHEMGTKPERSLITEYGNKNVILAKKLRE